MFLCDISYLGTTVPQDETLCPVGPRTTDIPHPGASTLISAPRSNQLGHLSLTENIVYIHTQTTK